MSSLLRLLQIAACAARHSIAFILWDLPKALWRGQPPSADRLTALLEDLGPTAIKLGQILSSRPDLISPSVAASLSRLQDGLKPFSAPMARRAMEASFQRPLGQIFREFDEQPVAAASIAQVHRGVLLDGREVAVKIRRPGVQRMLERDFHLMQRAARLLASLPGMRLLPVEDLVVEIMQPVYEQIDFELEAENNRILRTNFHLAERIAIPELVDELCTADVLVMRYYGDLRKIGEKPLSVEESRIVAVTGLRALYRMIFIDGFVHADLHPGNLMLRGRAELVMLDAGLAIRLDRQVQTDFVDFFFALVNNDGRVCAQIIERNALWRSSNYSAVRFERDVAGLIARHSALKSKDFEISAFVAELINTQRRCGIRGSTAFMMTVLAMVVYDGICKQLYPECDFQKEARPFLIVGRYSRQKLALVV